MSNVENEGADPNQPVESQEQADKTAQTEASRADQQLAAQGLTADENNQPGESTAAADKSAQTEARRADQQLAAQGLTADENNQPGESTAAADKAAEAEAARADQQLAAQGLTADENNQPGESTAAADKAAEAEVASADQQLAAQGLTNYENVGTQQYRPQYPGLPVPPMQAGIQLNTNPGISVFFKVTLDVVELGMWSKMSGLGMQLDTKSRPDSAMSFFEHHLPGHVTYTNITLERPVTSDTANVMSWISAYHMLPIPTAAEIMCLDQTGSVVMVWALMGVSPVSWKGPSMDVYTHNVATEVLTLAHMGFM